MGTHISGYLHLSQASYILILVISKIGRKVLFSFMENKILDLGEIESVQVKFDTPVIPLHLTLSGLLS